MITTDLLTKPIFYMTGREFLQLMKEIKPAAKPEIKTNDTGTGEFVCGISGLARFLGIGRTRAAQMRAERILEDATYSVGNKLFFHKEKVKEILRNQNY